MRIIASSRIAAFYTRHTDAKLPLEVWVSQMKEMEVKDLNELKKAAAPVQVTGNKTAIFQIKGDTYIIVTTISFPDQTIYIRWIGTPAAFDKEIA
jgi:mRNA interferase HigB